jgi:hypothetical protein
MEEKFFVRFKMASEIQNGGQFSMSCNFFATEYFFNRFSALCLCWKWDKIVEEVFSFWLKMALLARKVGQKWFFGHNFKGIQLFFVLFFALVLRNLYASFVEEKFWNNS